MYEIKLFNLKCIGKMLEENSKRIFMVAPIRNHKELKRLIKKNCKNPKNITLSFAQNKENVFRYAGYEVDELWIFETHYMTAFCYEYLKTLIRCQKPKRKSTRKTTIKDSTEIKDE